MSGRTAVVSGMVAGDPGQGGASWAVLQYVLGLSRLGFDVVLAEPVTTEPEQLLGRTAAARYFDDVMTNAGAGAGARAALLRPETGEVYGMSWEDLRALARRAELLINVSGMLPLDDPFIAIPIRVYLDLDPAYNQLWHAACGIDMHFVGHTHHVTVGQRVGRPDCDVPTCGLEWLPTLPPVVLDQWPVATALRTDALTTVANWRSYGSIELDGRFYGQKAHAFRQLLGLPAHTAKGLYPAIGIDAGDSADRAALEHHGWTVLDPAVVAGTPEAYHAFVQGSWAELGVAKSGYAMSHCGWFSDRSACYLASGRPVVAQDTGFDETLPTGKGLLMFGGVDEAAAAIEEVAARYDLHRAAARRIAEEHLDSAVVLGRLLREVGIR